MEFDLFTINIIIAGILLSLATSPLGCIIVWRRLTYFGDTMAHTSLLGVTLAIMLNVDIFFGILASGAITALIIVLSRNNLKIESNVILGIIAHGGLAIGVTLISLINQPGLSIEGLLFGDLLTIGTSYLYVLAGGVIITAVTLIICWEGLIISSISEDIANAENKNIRLFQFIYISTLTCVVAISIKIVGVLLVTSLLLIPAATARLLSTSPLGMLNISIATSVIATLNGIAISFYYDSPTGPTIVIGQLILFIIVISTKEMIKLLGKR